MIDEQDDETLAAVLRKRGYLVVKQEVCPDCGRPPGAEHSPRCPRIQRKTTTIEGD